jgi:23S rRNA U2552 (ribose-2'-O)-methylase RlmE/FtsJ
MLKKGGNMVMKTLQGENEKLFYDFYKVNFK